MIDNKLAIHGGEPVRKRYLSYGRQCIDEEDVQAVIDILRGDYLTTGPTVSLFEKKIADYVGAKYAVAVSNGTAALHMACFAAGIGPGDEVLVPPITFVASANCVLYCGGTPVFVDIDKDTHNIDVNKIEELITSRTKAIIPVDLAGQSVDMDKILEIAKKYNLIVIEDGAHALGSEYKGEKVGARADMTEFSFHPVKPITTGEGGIVVTNNKEYYERMKLFRTHGITKDKESMTKYDGPWYYEQIDLGYNYRITDIQCGLGISQLKKIDSFIGKRREIASIYDEELSKIPEVNVPFEESFSKSGYHIYTITLNLDMLKCNRREIFEALQCENIGVNVHYIPIYLQPYYRELGYKQGICPVAEEVYNCMITIPLFASMTNEDVNDVINAIKKVINYYRK